MLKSFAAFTDGVLPPTLSMSALADSVQQWKKTQGINTTPEEREALTAKLMPEAMRISRGLFFMADPRNGADWTYAGAGIKIGQAATPVLWYRPAAANAPAWRVFDADGSIHDSAAAPPGGEKVILNALPPTDAATGPALP